jgi:hypothetical protein
VPSAVNIPVVSWAVRHGVRDVTAALAIAALVLAACILTSCASATSTSGNAIDLEIPVQVLNQDISDATIYVVSGGTSWPIGRASGAATTQLGLPRAFEHQVVSMAARFDGGGGTIVSRRFVVAAEGFTITIARVGVGVHGND